MKPLLHLFNALVLICLATGSATSQENPAPDQPGAQDDTFYCGPCYARFAEDELIIGNQHIERRWRVRDGLLYPESFKDLAAETEWLDGPTSTPAPMPAVEVPAESRGVRFVPKCGTFAPTEEPSLLAELSAQGKSLTLVYRLQIFPGSRGVLMRLETRTSQPDTGDEHESLAAGANVLENLRLTSRPLAVRQTTFLDGTDAVGKDPLIEKTVPPGLSATQEMSGNLFVIEDPATSTGLVCIKHAPLPPARPHETPVDLRWDGGRPAATLFGHGTGPNLGPGDRWVVLAYHGGRAGRIATLQQYFRQLNTYDPERDGLLLSTAGGGGNAESSVDKSFMIKELQAAERLGVDVVRLDDGWQRGHTRNVGEDDGAWKGFWATNPEFWQVDPERFPGGLQPIVDAATTHGLGLGLWYASDPTGSFENADRDIERLLELHRNLGIDHFKLDAGDLTDRRSQLAFERLVNTALEQSDGKIVFDLDLTTQRRHGYLGLPHIGTLDFQNAHADDADPAGHPTLRNIWMLAQYLDPLRLRVSFPNVRPPTTHTDPDPSDYLFASIMFASPLARFDVQDAPEAYFERAGVLIRTWKQHREAIYQGTIIPFGEAPTGRAWTGFLSVGTQGRTAYALVLRESNEQPTATYELPLMAEIQLTCNVLAGQGTARVEDGRLQAVLEQPRSYLLVRLEPEPASASPSPEDATTSPSAQPAADAEPTSAGIRVTSDGAVRSILR